MRKNWWDSGNWNVICDCCGFKRKVNEVMERWDGFMVCRPDIQPGCWEPRHPQDMIRPAPEEKGVPWTRPESNDVLIASCTVAGRLGVCDYAIGDCAVCDVPIPPGYGDLELGILPVSDSY